MMAQYQWKYDTGLRAQRAGGCILVGRWPCIWGTRVAGCFVGVKSEPEQNQCLLETLCPDDVC